MRIALLCVVMAMGCSKKSETKTEPTQTEPAKPEAPKPAEDKPADKPPEAAPPEPKPAAAGAPTFDCNAIVTAADIEKACNAKVEIKPTMHEGKMGGKLGVCNRSMSLVGKKGPVALWSLSWHGDAKAAEGFVVLEKSKEAKELAGVGDFAWTAEREMKELKSTDYDVGARKGATVIKLGFTKNSLNPKPPCTLEQLVEVAKLAVARLP